MGFLIFQNIFQNLNMECLNQWYIMEFLIQNQGMEYLNKWCIMKFLTPLMRLILYPLLPILHMLRQLMLQLIIIIQLLQEPTLVLLETSRYKNCFYI